MAGTCNPKRPGARAVAWLLWLACASASACWEDADVQHRALQLAQRSFPTVARNMPSILVCSRSEYAPNVGGQYTSGVHRITVGDWHSPSDQDMVLLHELAHAQVALTGGDGGGDGHGPAWVKAMADAGLLHEARRMSAYSGDAAQAVAELDRRSARVAPQPQPLAEWVPAPQPVAPQEWTPPEVQRRWYPRPWNGGYQQAPLLMRQVCELRQQPVLIRLPHGLIVQQWQTVQVCRLVPA